MKRTAIGEDLVVPDRFQVRQEFFQGWQQWLGDIHRFAFFLAHYNPTGVLGTATGASNETGGKPSHQRCQMMRRPFSRPSVISSGLPMADCSRRCRVLKRWTPSNIGLAASATPLRTKSSSSVAINSFMPICRSMAVPARLGKVGPAVVSVGTPIH